MTVGGMCMSEGKKRGYEFIWSPRSSRKITFSFSKSVSPYMEINNDFINENFKDEGFKVKVNPYVRFNHIFSDYIDALKGIEKNQSEEYMKNISFNENIEHSSLLYLRKLDFITGTTIVDIYCEYIVKDIKEGVFGKRILKYFSGLSEEDQKELSLLIYNNIISKSENRKSLETGIRYFFPDSILYINKFDERKITVYINYKRSHRNKLIIKILKEFFLPFGIEVSCYWERHFGVVGVEAAMLTEEISVY